MTIPCHPTMGGRLRLLPRIQELISLASCVWPCSPALEDIPLENEPRTVARLGGAKPPRRLISSRDFDPTGERVDIGYQGECWKIGCTRTADLRFLSAERGHLCDKVRPSSEGLVDHLIGRVLESRGRRQGGEVDNLGRRRWEDPNALRQRHLGIAFSRKHVFQIESGLGFLLSCERNLRQGR